MKVTVEQRGEQPVLVLRATTAAQGIMLAEARQAAQALTGQQLQIEGSGPVRFVAIPLARARTGGRGKMERSKP